MALAEAVIGGPYVPGSLGAELDLTGYAPELPAGRAAVRRGWRPSGHFMLPGFCPAAHRAGRSARGADLPGRVGRSAGTLELQVGPHLFSWSTEALRRIYYEAIPRRMQHADVDRTAGE